MSFDDKFEKDIDNFQRYGTYTYKYDEVGNVIFNSSSNDFSEVYLGLPILNFVYDNSKVLNFYNPTFTEFIVKEDTLKITETNFQKIQNDLEAEKAQNLELTNKLNKLIEEQDSKPPDQTEAAKQVILELRKSLGQGRVDSDFSSDFPYSPLRKTSNIDSINTIKTKDE